MDEPDESRAARKPHKPAPEPAALEQSGPASAVVVPSAILEQLGQVPPGASFVVQQVEMWQGQFPPPEAIERYERVMPGAFNRIVAMAEKRMDAEIEAATKNAETRRDDVARGQILGAFVTVGAMVGAGVCAAFDQPFVAGLFLAVPVMSVAVALVNSTKKTPVNTIAMAPTPRREKPRSEGDEVDDDGDVADR